MIGGRAVLRPSQPRMTVFAIHPTANRRNGNRRAVATIRNSGSVRLVGRGRHSSLETRTRWDCIFQISATGSAASWPRNCATAAKAPGLRRWPKPRPCWIRSRSRAIPTNFSSAGFPGAQKTADDFFQALEKALAAYRTLRALLRPQLTGRHLVWVSRQVPSPTRHKLQRPADADQPAV